ncbi:MAG: transglutaminase-like domain-containing protein, partial [Chloroflexota bacterium]|nr:transglutaminase-like domain-containing protein [Chloroflexota bacterium]
MQVRTPLPGFGDAGRLSLRAEFMSLSCHLLMLWSVIAAMERVDSSDRWAVLGPLATAGLLLGFALARTRVQDLMAHSVAVWLGALASFVVVGTRGHTPLEIVEGRGSNYRELFSGVVQSLLGQNESPVETDQLLVVLGITSWLLAYSSAWVIYRRRWFAAGIGVPAAILLTSLRIDDANGGWPLALFLAGAIGLAARDSFAGHVQRWSVRRLPAPRALATGFMAAALPISVCTVLIALTVNPAIQSTVHGAYREELVQQWDSLSDDMLQRLGIEADGHGNYTTFPDEWEIGGELDLGDEIVAVVTSDEPHYLALRRYDRYSGKGWSSDVGSTFAMEGDDPDGTVTHVTFREGAAVPLSSEVDGSRESNTVAIRVQRPKGDLLFTVDSFSGASQDVLAIMGWLQIDGLAIDVNAVRLSEVPIDLLGVVTAARNQGFRVESGGGGVIFDDPSVNARLQREVDRLAGYPVTVDLVVDSEGALIALFSGRVPNYDDVESVFSSQDIEPGHAYSVDGQETRATSDDLANAGTDYPAWVEDRYLQIPSIVTNRTVELAQTIVSEAGAADPFSQALAIQNYLRANIVYEENSPPPPGDQDWVDYVLFDHPAGRCEQYATSMVVLTRSLGIPARIASGYRSQDEVNAAGDYVYRERQAHTWVEVFFPGYGWIPFEPTATMDTFDLTDQTAEATSVPLEVTPEPTAEPIATETAAATPEADASPVPPALVAPENDAGSFGGLLLYIGAIGMTLAVGILAYLILSWRSGLGGLPPAAGLFARLIKVGRWFGVEPHPAATPAEYARSFSRALPGTEGAA